MFFFFTNLITTFLFFKSSLFIVPVAFIVAVIFPIDVKDIIFITAVIIVINVFEYYEFICFFYNFIRFNKRTKFAGKFFKPGGRFKESVLKLRN